MLIRPLMTSFEMTIRADCAVSACSPLLCLLKLLPTDFGLWNRYLCSLPLPLLPLSKLKQIFLSTNLPLYWLFERRSADSILSSSISLQAVLKAALIYLTDESQHASIVWRMPHLFNKHWLASTMGQSTERYCSVGHTPAGAYSISN